MQYFIGICLLTVINYVSPSQSLPSDNNLEQYEKEILSALSKTFDHDKNQHKKSGELLKKFDLNKNFTIQSHIATYQEKDCSNPVRLTAVEKISVSTQDNRMGILIQYNQNTLGCIISPDSDLQGFNIDFELSEYSEGIQFHFNNNQLVCRKENAISQITDIKAEVCVKTTHMRRGPGRNIEACFYVGGALLSSKFYDINTINSFSGLMAAVAGLGCYTANNTNISFIENSDQINNSEVTDTLTKIVTPLNNMMCNSASNNIPRLLLTILSLSIIYLQRL